MAKGFTVKAKAPSKPSSATGGAEWDYEAIKKGCVARVSCSVCQVVVVHIRS